ncbi:Protein of unknown function DUF241 [Macleaya cordata]|uniref:DUF241 domain protein n=1 Tax=Macleaya cordata TaxID=56857 RepID=A0A200QYT4_MACCD|nr:Protein of unknown function DUF241 [Macleaya cordata]
MAASPLNPKALFRHTRSVSLPSRSNPLTIRVEEQLHTLRSSAEATTSSTSPSFIFHCLCGLKDLFERVDDLLRLPLVQTTLANERSDKKCVNEVLNGSLRMLDVCGTTTDVLSQMKQCVQDLQSSLRRRRRVGNEFGLANEFGSYMFSRKKLNKVIRKCLEDLKRMNNNTPILAGKNHEVVVAIVGVLREVEAVTLSMFGSILVFLDGSKSQSKPRGWSLVSKLMHTKHVASIEGEDSADDIHEVEKTLSALISTNRSSDQKLCKDNERVRVQNALKRFEAFESNIQELEEGLACVSRCLIKNRVSILNSLNH